MTRASETGFAHNNFDLIRLVAALQVAVTHAAAHLGIEARWINLLEYVPGVPVFFFVSGFLIYRSYTNIKEQRLRTFFTNRFLRLYPGLWVCLAASIVMVTVSGYWNEVQVTPREFLPWVAAQASFFQFFNPDFLRGYGTGVLNGSLWTISVEVQFYVLTPLIFLVVSRYPRAWIPLFVLFVILNTANTALNDKDSIAGKLFAVSFLPWLSMFLLGAWFSTSERARAAVLRVHLLWLLAAFLAAYQLSVLLGLGAGNKINTPTFFLLVCLVLKCAYSMPDLASKLLRRNDISYGIYIYHMPVVNFLLHSRTLIGTYAGFFLALLGTIVLSTLSWFAVEKPALRRKKATLRAVAA